MANIVDRLPTRGPFTVLASAARTAAPDTKEFEAPGVQYNGMYLVIDVTAISVTPSITVTVFGVDRVSGKKFPTAGILASAPITATGTTVLQVGPGITAAANSKADDHLPPIFRIEVTHLDADSITYSIAGVLCP